MKDGFNKKEIIAEIASELSSTLDINAAAASAVKIISRRLPYYKWVGVYWLQTDVLVLGPYVGAPTEHDRIKVGSGVCGTAVAQNRNQVIEDVRTLDNYLACSLETRSEIVALIRNKNGAIIGQIDADGDGVGDFDSMDEAFLSEVAALIAAKK